MNSPGQPLQIVGLGMATVDFLVRMDEPPTWERGARLYDLTLDGGGPVGTAMVAAARLGARVGFCGTAGNDDTADFKVSLLEKEHIDTSHLLRRDSPEREVILVCIHGHTGERVFSGTSRTGHNQLNPEELDREYLTQADILHLDGFHFQAALQAARWMREAGKLISLDAAKTNGQVSDQTVELVRQTDILICGAGFSRALTGCGDIPQAGQQILALGPQVFVETLGEEGCITVTEQETFHTPAFPVEVVDTTGAGDVFHGAYLVGLTRGWKYREIARFAAATAALKCRQMGGRRGIPDFQTVVEFLKNDPAPGES